jgi:ketosteroid isomerase-like protein
MNLIPLTCSVLLAAMAPCAPAAEQQLRALEKQIAEAVVGGDVAFVERFWDDDFIYTGVRGEVKRKAEVVAEFKAGTLKFDLMRFDDIRVAVHGDTAVVTGRAVTKGRNSNGEITGEFRYTRVYVKRADGWKVVAFQGTPVVVR